VLQTNREAAVLLAALATCFPSLPAAAEAPSGPPVDGIRCDQMESSVFHIHAHVAIFARGKPVAIPADVGRPVVGGCLYWLHTHTADGLVHVESPVFRTFTLGQLFDVWGQPLSATNVAGTKVSKGQLRVYVDGNVRKGDPRAIELAQHTDIVVEAGPPYHAPTPFADWNGQ
jgi:hypothetical protein